MQAPSACMMALMEQVGSALCNSLLHLEDASSFSRHVPIYHLPPSQACFLMIRIMHTSFTFIDWLLFRESQALSADTLFVFCSPLPSLPLAFLPLSHLSFLGLVTCDVIFSLPASFSCS